MFSRRGLLIAASGAVANALPQVVHGETITYDRIIDVYDPNHLNLDEAKRNNVGAIIYQTGQGMCRIDNEYSTYRARAKEQNFLWGAYFMLSTESNDTQLKQLVKFEDGKDKSTLIAIDWEKTCGAKMSFKQLTDFVHRFVDKLGFYPMIYGGDLIRECKQLQDGDELFAKCPVWYLRFLSTPKGLPTKTWPKYTLWQYDDEHRNNGAPPPHVLDGADWNRYQGTFNQLKKDWPFRREV